MVKYLVILMVAASLHHAALSQDALDQAAARSECGEKASQADLHDCLGRKVAKSESELKQAEDRVQALEKWDEDSNYIAQAKMNLEASSKEFERFRKSHCAFMASLAGGAAGNSREIMRLVYSFTKMYPFPQLKGRRLSSDAPLASH